VNAVCPVCSRPQDQGLTCHACTSALEYELRDVPAVVAELDVTLAKQARMEGGKAGLASERNGYHQGASLAADYLQNTLTTWARDVAEVGFLAEHFTSPPRAAARILLNHITEIRRHPAAAELHDEITSAVRQARAAADRPANRTTFPVGPCPEDTDSGPCPGEVVAFIPTEDERPSWLRCQADEAHRWSSIQFYRVGERIRRRMEARRKAGAA
jgi:hypothetical protein